MYTPVSSVNTCIHTTVRWSDAGRTYAVSLTLPLEAHLTSSLVGDPSDTSQSDALHHTSGELGTGMLLPSCPGCSKDEPCGPGFYCMVKGRNCMAMHHRKRVKTHHAPDDE